MDVAVAVADDSVDDGQSIFELAWAQGVGCGVMGLALGLREEIDALYVVRRVSYSIALFDFLDLNQVG